MNDSEHDDGRVLVLYHTRSGNTKLMAELVAAGADKVARTQVRLLSVDEATADDLVWADGVAAGCPTHMGSISWEMKRWWDDVARPVWPHAEGKIGCAFSSAGGIAGGSELTCLALMIVLMNYGMLTFGIPDYVAVGRTLHYGPICAGRPRDEADEAACDRMGRRLAEWVQVYRHNRPELGPAHADYPRFPW